MKKSLSFSLLGLFTVLSPSTFAAYHHGYQRRSAYPVTRRTIDRRKETQRLVIHQPANAAHALISPAALQIQAICDQLRQIIEHPSAEGYHNGINLLAQLRALDLTTFGHYRQIFDRTLGHLRNGAGAQPQGAARPETPAVENNDNVADEAEDNDNTMQEIQRLRAENRQLRTQLANAYHHQQAAPQANQQPPAAQAHHDAEPQQARVAQLQDQVRRLQAQATQEHHMIQLLGQINPQLTEAQIQRLINDYNQEMLHRFNFNMQPIIEQIGRRDLRGAIVNINRHNQDHVFRFFALNHPIVQIAQQELIAAQLEGNQQDAPVDQDADLQPDAQDDADLQEDAQQDEQPANEQAQAAEYPEPSAPPLTPDIEQDQEQHPQAPAVARNLPRPRPRPRAEHVAVEIPNEDDEHQDEPRANAQPSAAERVLDYVQQLPAAAAQAATNIYNGLHNRWTNWWNDAGQ